ncbi:Uncharacterised protein [Candidatus Gugararchaeum adminiculabundum]|nr:Uncharacterised protein [Candidatus Gugararchaeum adminiculabundum]
MTKIFAFDIETRSLGPNSFESAVELLSLQLCSGSGKNGLEKLEIEFFCKDGGKGKDLRAAAARLEVLCADKDALLVGYNVSQLDLHAVKKFLGLEIPAKKVYDILESDAVKKVKELYGYTYLRLERLLNEYGMEADYKQLMQKRANELMRDPRWVEEITSEFKREIMSDKNVLRRIAIGHAVSRAYDEFVASGMDVKSDFYKYAVGDAVAEYEFYVRHCGGKNKA